MESVLVITGAGVSVPSGIPTYRGKGKNLPVISIHDGNHWEWANQFRDVMKDAKSNRAHYILAEMERRHDRFLLATQNVDGLHQQAGNRCITELHGNIWQIAKPKLTDYSEDPQFEEDQRLLGYAEFRDEILERWSQENNRDIWENREVPYCPTAPDERPNVLFLDESYGNRLLWVQDFIKRGVDTILVVGCSGGIQIVSRLISDAKKSHPQCKAISINPGQHEIEGIDEDIRMEAIEGLEELLPGLTG